MNSIDVLKDQILKELDAQATKELSFDGLELNKKLAKTWLALDEVQKCTGESGDERLTPEQLHDWLSHMENVDGSKSPHWTVEQTSAVAASVGICLDHVTDLEFSVAMNMVYSDFCMTARKYGTDTTGYYGDMAKAWLFDRDGGKPSVKLYRKYKYMVLPART